MPTWFPDFVKDPEQEVDFLSQCTLIFDTNAWLDLYRIRPAKAKEILGILQKMSGLKRLFTPRIIESEFVRNQAAASARVKGEYDKDIDDLTRRFNDFRGQGILNSRHFLKQNEFLIAYNKVIIRIREEANEFDELSNSDDILTKDILNLIITHLGPSWDLEQEKKIIDEGKTRTTLNKPPGVTDKDKKIGNRDLGDWFIWKQAMNFARSEKKIFC